MQTLQKQMRAYEKDKKELEDNLRAQERDFNTRLQDLSKMNASCEATVVDVRKLLEVAQASKCECDQKRKDKSGDKKLKRYIF